MWTVAVKRKLLRKIATLPIRVQALFANLKSDLEANGPEQPSWSNYSKLDRNKYHCHLTHHYVACWKVEADNTLIMEVYYVGTREGAPY